MSEYFNKRRGGEQLPKYVNELSNLCSRAGILCQIDAENKIVLLPLEAARNSGYYSAFIAVIGDIRTYCFSWDIQFDYSPLQRDGDSKQMLRDGTNPRRFASS